MMASVRLDPVVTDLLITTDCADGRRRKATIEKHTWPGQFWQSMQRKATILRQLTDLDFEIH